jgi:hypothetical protein
MDENRITGTARNLGGKAEEGIGRVTGDTYEDASRGDGRPSRRRRAGLIGQARDTAADAAVTACDWAASLEKWLRWTIETQPYTGGAIT